MGPEWSLGRHHYEFVKVWRKNYQLKHIGFCYSSNSQTNYTSNHELQSFEVFPTKSHEELGTKSFANVNKYTNYKRF